MGLWRFVKDAGKKVFGDGDDAEVYEPKAVGDPRSAAPDL